jgi:hypothetical protein
LIVVVVVDSFLAYTNTFLIQKTASKTTKLVLLCLD